MNSSVVGIADCCVVRDPERSLVTYALGSCIAVALCDKTASVGGLLHFMCPNPEAPGNTVNPFRCGQTGIPLLIDRMLALGAERRRLEVYLAGGAQMLEQNRLFNVGSRNHTAARHVLWKAGLTVTGERVGGHVSRTVGLDISTGHFWVQEQGLERVFLPRQKSRRT